MFTVLMFLMYCENESWGKSVLDGTTAAGFCGKQIFPRLSTDVLSPRTSFPFGQG